MDYKNLQDNIKALENELRDLKTVQGAIVGIEAYHYRATLSSILSNKRYKITYEKGDQPLILVINSDIWVPIQLAVEDDHQYILSSVFTGTVDLFSNWKILSVEEA